MGRCPGQDTPCSPNDWGKTKWRSFFISSSFSFKRCSSKIATLQVTKTGWKEKLYTLQGINISHLGKRKIIFKMPFLGDMLVSWRVSNKIFSPFVSRNASPPFPVKKRKSTKIPLKKHPGTPKNRNFHDPFLDESLRYLASAWRNDLFFSSASSSAWWSDYWIKTSLSKQKGRNIRDSTNSETIWPCFIIGPFPMPCWNFLRRWLQGYQHETHWWLKSDAAGRLLLFSSLRSLQVLKRLSSRTENQFGWTNVLTFLRKLR